MFSKSTKPGQLAQTLRQEIQTGRLQPGQRLMSINDLSQVYKVSVRTVREALALLEQDGYLACRSRRRAVILTGPPQPEQTLIRAKLIRSKSLSDPPRFASDLTLAKRAVDEGGGFRSVLPAE